MHTLGLSQKQLDGVTSELLQRSMKLQDALPVLAEADCVADLKQHDGWKSDQEYTANVQRAFQAGKQYAGAEFEGILKDYGNDARIVRMLAKVGSELEEDRSASPEAQAQIQDNLDALMSSKAYMNANDPGHAAAAAKVAALTAKQVGTRPMATGRSMSFKTG